jgi:hypothetical protein
MSEWYENLSPEIATLLFDWLTERQIYKARETALQKAAKRVDAAKSALLQATKGVNASDM